MKIKANIKWFHIFVVDISAYLTFKNCLVCYIKIKQNKITKLWSQLNLWTAPDESSSSSTPVSILFGRGQLAWALLIIKSVIIWPADPLSEGTSGSLSLEKSSELSNLLLKKICKTEWKLQFYHIPNRHSNNYIIFTALLFFRVICL